MDFLKKKKAFYAYSSNSSDLLNDIRKAIIEINEVSNEVHITSWEDFVISGRPIINNILKAIDECDLFMCDLTFLNNNVLYELGYAIAKKKAIWISLNSTHSNATTNYKMFNLITSIGYSRYQNTVELKSNFYSDIPYEHTDKPTIIFNDPDINRNLLYLKCEAGTSSSSALHTLVKDKSRLPVKIDDLSEAVQPLNWYLKVLPNSFGVIIHFHTNNSEIEGQNDLARKSLIAGLSKGLNVHALLLAHHPFEAPLDYREDVRVHSNPTQCEEIAKDWLSPIIEEYQAMVDEHKIFKADQSAVGQLNNLIVGDYVAENESKDLTEYFLETAEYNEALKAQQILFVGRKGTGKTANLIKLKKTLSEDKRNFVVSIQPQGHEFEGVLDIMEQLRANSEQGNFIESIWKYLIYTEISKQYYEWLDNQPLHYEKTKAEEEFELYVSSNSRVIDADFTLRLENAVKGLRNVNVGDSIEEQRKKISEYLHSNMLTQLRKHLGATLQRKEGVKILIDNLDKGWNDSTNLTSLSDLLLGLLNVVQKITSEFQRNTYKHEPVNVSLIVFLRSDIFSRVMSLTPERDKIATKHLDWTDSQLLFRVIEKRINYSSNGITSPDSFWNDYFCSTVKGIPLKQYIQQLIIPRPRDIIFLFKMALQEALNNNHSKVTEADFISAEYAYSEYAFSSLLPENGKRITNLESILFEFAGQSEIINHEEILQCVINATESPNELIQILCEITFIGQETMANKFEFFSEKRPSQITNKLAQRYAERSGKPKRYKINPAFHEYLGITKE